MLGPPNERERFSRKKILLCAFAGVALVGLGALAWLSVRQQNLSSRNPSGGSETRAPASAAQANARALDHRNSWGDLPAQQSALFATYGKSPSCQACHTQDFQLWAGSHHALAERPVDGALDETAFAPAQKIRHGSQTSEVRSVGGKFELVTLGLDGQPRVFDLKRVIGVAPLRQYLTSAEGNRLQATELAFDPQHPGWFDMFGEEDRRPGEWGHWTGRGMTWNSMCAACHNTRVRKNYQESTDSYATSMAEMGVGCEACHGPLASHNAWQAAHPKQTPDPTLRRINRQEMFWVCGSCHSRRTELTGDFVPGDHYLDHHVPTIPDDTEIFHPDGQVREENYEWAPFLGSKMAAFGVRCTDCHEPHSLKTRFPGDALCLSCHGPPAAPSPKIDPVTHSHHQAGTRGSHCADCHMPQTVYMQRHARHDHGLTVPDPLLTKQFGIPNACTRCHTERDADWALGLVQEWYGAQMERPSRTRAQLVARARAGDSAAAQALASLLRAQTNQASSSPSSGASLVLSETNSFWRAVFAGSLKRWAKEPKVEAALLAGATDPDPLVRAMSLRSLGTQAPEPGSRVERALRAGLTDEIRAVRIEAAWSLRSSLDTNSTAGSDLLADLRHNADQPAGALQSGVFSFDRGDLSAAMKCFKRAVEWDENSAPLRAALAVGLSLQGRANEAVEQLRAACRLAPRDAEFEFKLGLALNEAGKPDEARAALERAVILDPQYSAAWYNLGLARNAAGETEPALECLLRAESLAPSSPQIPYARATILAGLGRRDEARSAAKRVLQIEPGYTPAADLLRSLAVQPSDVPAEQGP